MSANQPRRTLGGSIAHWMNRLVRRFRFVREDKVRAMLADPVSLRTHVLRYGPAGYDLIDHGREYHDVEVLVEYDGKEGHRDWQSASAWLYPGQALAVVSRPPHGPAQEPGAKSLS